MAEIELGALSERLEEDELKKLAAVLDRAGVRYDVEKEYPSHTVAARLSEDAMTEFLDRLDAHDLGAEIYLPVEFDGVFAVGDYRIASAPALADALEELRDELGIDEDEDDEGDEEDGDEEEHIIAAQLKNIWQLMTDACEECIDRGVPLHVQV